jgi:DNA-binding NarL/FixJ family response regulator
LKWLLGTIGTIRTPVDALSPELIPLEGLSAARVAYIEIGEAGTAHVTGIPFQDVVEALQTTGTRVVITGRRTLLALDTGALSEREAEIMKHIGSGLSNKEIASQLFLSTNTVKSYIRSVYHKLGIGSRSEAVLWAVDHELVDPHHPRV